MPPPARATSRSTDTALIVQRNAKPVGAFTLLELLIVLSIVALLVALLLPALRSARTAAQQVGSLSNARQIAVSLHAYAVDNGQSMPLMQQGDDHGRWWNMWSQEIAQAGYVSDTGVFWSAARTRMDIGVEDERAPWIGDPRPTAYTWECVGYGLNVGVGGGHILDIIAGTAQAPLRLDESGAPPAADMLLLAETYSAKPGTSGGSLHGYWWAQPGSDTNDSELRRLFNYNGAVTRAYVDGSASAPRATGDTYTGFEPYIDQHGHKPMRRDAIGWAPGDRTPNGEMRGHYAGSWKYAFDHDGRHHTPWFWQWRKEWHRGLRDDPTP